MHSQVPRCSPARAFSRRRYCVPFTPSAGSVHVLGCICPHWFAPLLVEQQCTGHRPGCILRLRGLRYATVLRLDQRAADAAFHSHAARRRAVAPAGPVRLHQSTWHGCGCTRVSLRAATRATVGAAAFQPLIALREALGLASAALLRAVAPERPFRNTWQSMGQACVLHGCVREGCRTGATPSRVTSMGAWRSACHRRSGVTLAPATPLRQLAVHRTAWCCTAPASPAMGTCRPVVRLDLMSRVYFW